MSIGLYSITTRAVGTVLTAAIYNADHQNHVNNQNPSMTGAYSDNVGQMQTTKDPGTVGGENLAGSLADELAELRFVIKKLHGQAQWYPGLQLMASQMFALTDGATINWNTTSGNYGTVTLAGNRTFAAPTNLVSGYQYVLEITQDGTGGRTLTWNAIFKGPLGNTMPQPNPTAASVTTFVFEYNGTNLTLVSPSSAASPQVLTDGATINWPVGVSQTATVTVAGNRTIAAPTGLLAGEMYTLKIKQDGTGGRTITWNAVFKADGGATMPQPSPAINAETTYLFWSPDGTNLYLVSRKMAPTTTIYTTGSGTYNPPAGATRLKVKLLGAGGGGGAQDTNPGATGGTTQFDGATYQAGGGVGGLQGGGANGTAAGGTTTGGTVAFNGAAGQPGQLSVAAASGAAGGGGGPGIYGGAGAPGPGNTAGGAAANYTGSGGGGAGAAASNGVYGGSGGGAGAYVEVWLTILKAAYTYTVGAAGAGGTAGTKAGGAGAVGLIIIEEYYD